MKKKNFTQTSPAVRFTIIFVNNLQYLLRETHETERIENKQKEKSFHWDNLVFWGHCPKVSKALIAVPRVAQKSLRRQPGRPLFHLWTPSCKIFQRLSIERRSEIVPSLSGALLRVALTHIDTAGPTSRCCFWCIREKQKCLWMWKMCVGKSWNSLRCDFN